MRGVNGASKQPPSHGPWGSAPRMQELDSDREKEGGKGVRWPTCFHYLVPVSHTHTHLPP